MSWYFNRYLVTPRGGGVISRGCPQEQVPVCSSCPSSLVDQECFAVSLGLRPSSLALSHRFTFIIHFYGAQFRTVSSEHGAQLGEWPGGDGLPGQFIWLIVATPVVCIRTWLYHQDARGSWAHVCGGRWHVSYGCLSVKLRVAAAICFGFEVQASW